MAVDTLNYFVFMYWSDKSSTDVYIFRQYKSF